MDRSIEAEFQRLLGAPVVGVGSLPDMVGLGSLPDPMGDATALLEARRRQQVEGAGYDPDKGLYDRYSEMLGTVLGPTIAERAGAAADAMRRGDMATANALTQSLALDFGQFLGSIKSVRAMPGDLPMPAREVAIRAQGYLPETFYRGSGTRSPNDPPMHGTGFAPGRWFSRDPGESAGYASAAGRRGLGDPEMFGVRLAPRDPLRLDDWISRERVGQIAQVLERKYPNLYGPFLYNLPAEPRVRSIDHLFDVGPKDLRAPFLPATALDQFARTRAPDYASFIRSLGFDAVDHGRDILMLTDKGIRAGHAAFDPKRKGSADILAGIAALSLPLSTMLGIESFDDF